MAVSSNLGCRIYALATRGDNVLPGALTGLDVDWTRGARINGVVHDLYVLDSAVGTREVLNLYDRIRHREPNVPVIIVAAARNTEIVRARIEGDSAAYLAPRSGLMALRQLVDRVMEAVHARTMAARLEETRAVIEGLYARQLGERSAAWRRKLTSKSWLLIRAESMQRFMQGGGTAARFDQLWPGVCHEALETEPAER